MSASSKKNIVPCVAWVKQGCAKQNPDKVSLDKDELKKIIQKTQKKLDGQELSDDEMEDEQEEENEDKIFASAIKKAENMAATIKKSGGQKRKKEEPSQEDDIVDKYGLDAYDDDDTSSDIMHGIAGLTPFASNDEDPYITLKNEVDSDDEDFVLKPTDNLLAVGKVTDEAAILEVHIYNGDMNQLFIHHDYILPTFPLVLEWLDFDPADGDTGNFLAMGTMEPDIGLWNLDVVDSLEPLIVLEGSKPKAKKKKMKKKEVLVEGHSDAVLDLSWNRNVRNVLGSASADKTVCLWDLAQAKAVSTLTHHEKQVQCISWHPFESQSLLTGSFDCHAAVTDCRNPSENVKKWKFKGEVERAFWNHFAPFNFLASTDQGMLYEVDTRQDKPLFTLSAHDQAVTGMTLSSQIPGLLLTTSTDKNLKVWDIQDSQPSLVLSRNLKMDILHCVTCNPDHPFVFCVGANRDFKVWDIRESAAVRRHFLSRMPTTLAAECADDEKDLPEDEAADAFENLNMEDMEDEEDAAEEAEMLAGDRKPSKAGTSVSTDGQVKKKKKKKKKKKLIDSL